MERERESESEAARLFDSLSRNASSGSCHKKFLSSFFPEDPSIRAPRCWRAPSAPGDHPLIDTDKFEQTNEGAAVSSVSQTQVTQNDTLHTETDTNSASNSATKATTFPEIPLIYT